MGLELELPGKIPMWAALWVLEEQGKEEARLAIPEPEAGRRAERLRGQLRPEAKLREPAARGVALAVPPARGERWVVAKAEGPELCRAEEEAVGHRVEVTPGKQVEVQIAGAEGFQGRAKAELHRQEMEGTRKPEQRGSESRDCPRAA